MIKNGEKLIKNGARLFLCNKAPTEICSAKKEIFMGFIQTQLSQLVKTVLMSGETKKIKMFTVSGQSLAAVFYQALAAKMSMFDSMTVEHNPALGTQAEYDSKDNVMYLGFTSISYDDTERKGVIIHEATHAVSDMTKMSISLADSEVMAYVAQCQFMLANSGDYGMTGNTKTQTAIFAAAWTAARKIQNNVIPTEADYKAVRDAVCADDKYGMKALSQVADFNGLSK